MRIDAKARAFFATSLSPEKESQASKSARRMPGRIRPMKDAETGETFKGSCMQAMSLEIPNGATLPE